MTAVAVFSPAKVNLCLRILGKREDGYHNLFSLAAPVQFGDTLWIRARESTEDLLHLDHPNLPGDGTNLILQAVERFRALTGMRTRFEIQLRKRIPLESGLGGGSSNAVATLRGLQQLTGVRLKEDQFLELAIGLGSDCPLFIPGGPVVFEGRGERVFQIPPGLWERMKSYSLLVITPGYGVNTGWAFRHSDFPDNGEARVAEWKAKLESVKAGKEGLEALLHNDFEPLICRKYLAFAEARDTLRSRFGLPCLLSGSGSSFFCLSRDQESLARAAAWVRESLGGSISCVEARFSTP